MADKGYIKPDVAALGIHAERSASFARVSYQPGRQPPKFKLQGRYSKFLASVETFS